MKVFFTAEVDNDGLLKRLALIEELAHRMNMECSELKKQLSSIHEEAVEKEEMPKKELEHFKETIL
ncbi:MAG: hypothetical protein J6D08_16595 [Lachnospiraceae bacterium]|nr:hypothetical protein [Lachnospiraceae bacterium]